MNRPQVSALPAGFPREISREEMAELPIRRYEGDIVLVSSPRELERAVADIHAESVAGWDTETRPAFRRGESYLPSLLQVATARAAYLFQLERMDFSAEIAAIFGAAGILKVGISVADDLTKLRQVIALRESSVIDAGKLAQRHGMKQPGLRNLAGIFLGIRVPKGTKTSNWATPRLSAAQIGYAATDAWVCRELYLRFRQMGLA